MWGDEDPNRRAGARGIRITGAARSSRLARDGLRVAAAPTPHTSPSAGGRRARRLDETVVDGEQRIEVANAAMRLP